MPAMTSSLIGGQLFESLHLVKKGLDLHQMLNYLKTLPIVKKLAEGIYQGRQINPTLYLCQICIYQVYRFSLSTIGHFAIWGFTQEIHKVCVTVEHPNVGFPFHIVSPFKFDSPTNLSLGNCGVSTRKPSSSQCSAVVRGNWRVSQLSSSLASYPVPPLPPPVATYVFAYFIASITSSMGRFPCWRR